MNIPNATALRYTPVAADKDKILRARVTAGNKVIYVSAHDPVIDPAAPPVDTSAPGPVRNLSLTPGNARAQYAFAPPTEIGGSVISRYEYRIGTSGNWVRLGLTRSGTITGLTNGQAVTVYFRAVNSNGNGEAISRAVTPAAPTTPGTGTIADQSLNSGDTYRLDLDTVFNTEGRGNIYYQASSSATNIATVALGGTRSKDMVVTAVANGDAIITVNVITLLGFASRTERVPFTVMVGPQTTTDTFQRWARATRQPAAPSRNTETPSSSTWSYTSQPQPTSTEAVFELLGTRTYEDGVFQSAVWTVTRVAEPSGDSTSYYRRSTTRPSTPSGSSTAGWSTSQPTATSSQGVWESTRTTSYTNGVASYDWSVPFEVTPRLPTTTAYYRRAASRPSAPSSSAQTPGTGWTTTVLTPTTTQSVWRIIGTRHYVDGVFSYTDWGSITEWRTPVVSAPVIGSIGTITVQRGGTIRRQASVSGGRSPYTWDFTTNLLSLRVSSSGLITGSISSREVTGGYSHTVRVTDANGNSDTETFTVRVSAPPPLSVSISPTRGGTGTVLRATVTGGSGTRRYQWQFRASNRNTWSNLTRSSGSTLTIFSGDPVGTQYRVTVSDSTGSATSNTAIRT